MFSNHKLLVIFLLHWYCCTNSKTNGSELNILRPTSNQPANHRFKRDGGAIPFRPLFVYRQQQKEKQARWKLLEAQKLFRQQLHLQSIASNQQNVVGYHTVLSPTPTKLDYQVYPTYQTTSSYQTNPTNQQYLRYYPVNTYETIPKYRYYSTFEPIFDNNQDFYDDEYISGYYS